MLTTFHSRDLHESHSICDTATGDEVSKFEQATYTYAAGTIAERPKAWTVFAHADAGTVGSNTSQGMDV
jgi:hypothetical protein